nr:hypothetical protein 35 [Bacillaceae bacterium]
MIRYHFMLKEITLSNNDYIYQFMDFEGARIVRGRLEEIKNSENEKLKEDFRQQWKKIKDAPPYNPFKHKK